MSLPHTFFGWEGIPYSETTHGNPVTVSSVGGTEVELVDRDENCETAADRICDTPPDFNFPFAQVQNDDDPLNNISSGCGLIKDIFDMQNRLIIPAATNAMSYFSGCQFYEFSPQQIELMDADFNSPERENLRTGYIPNLGEVTEVPEILSPGTTADFYIQCCLNGSPWKMLITI